MLAVTSAHLPRSIAVVTPFDALSPGLTTPRTKRTRPVEIGSGLVRWVHPRGDASLDQSALLKICTNIEPINFLTVLGQLRLSLY